MLPQGGSTSPSISNIITKRLDGRLEGVARSYGLSYTRYADDLCFSGRYIPHAYVDIIERIIKEEGFFLNKTKTRLMIGNCRKIVTGISVSSNEPKVPKKYKREIRKEIHYLELYGAENVIKHQKRPDPLYLERLMGRLNFWNMVEPGNSFVAKGFNTVRARMKELSNG